MLLLLIGAYFNYKLEQTKQHFQLLELEVKRIEVTRGFLEELFSGTPQRAFVAERLISNIVEEKLATEISTIVKVYYAGQIDELISKNIEEASKIKATAEEISSPASKEIIEKLKKSSYYVVVASVDSKDKAKTKVEELRKKGYERSVAVLSNIGLYGVTLGQYSFDEANQRKRGSRKGGSLRKIHTL